MSDNVVDFYLNLQKKSLSSDPVEAVYASFLKEFSEPIFHFLQAQGKRGDRTPSDLLIGLNLSFCNLLASTIDNMCKEDVPEEIRKEIFNGHLIFFCDAWKKMVESIE